MPETESLDELQIAAINFARLWPYDESNRYNDEMLDFQVAADDDVLSIDDAAVARILEIKETCSTGDTGFFGCIVGGCEALFKTEHERGEHQTAHLAQHDAAYQQQVQQASRGSAPSTGTGSYPANRAQSYAPTGRMYECFGCDQVFATYKLLLAHKPSCPKTKYQQGNAQRTFRGGYHDAFYTCFHCEYFTSTLDRVKAHSRAGCTRRTPNDEVGYDMGADPAALGVPGYIKGMTTLYNGVGYVLTEHGWETMRQVAEKVDATKAGPTRVTSALNPAASATPKFTPSTPPPVPANPPMQPSSGIDLSSLPTGRYASVDVNGRVWFFYVSRRKTSTGWGYYGRPAGTIEVKRYESDNLQLVGHQKPGEEYCSEGRSYGHHEDDLRYILSNPAACAKLYAVENTRCYVCGKMLTDPDSIRRGIGPDCYAQGKGFSQHHHR